MHSVQTGTVVACHSVTLIVATISIGIWRRTWDQFYTALGPLRPNNNCSVIVKLFFNNPVVCGTDISSCFVAAYSCCSLPEPNLCGPFFTEVRPASRVLTGLFCSRICNLQRDLIVSPIICCLLYTIDFISWCSNSIFLNASFLNALKTNACWVNSDHFKWASGQS